MTTTTEPRQRGTRKPKGVTPQPVGFTIGTADFKEALRKLNLVAVNKSGFLAILSDAKAHVTKTRVVFQATDLEQTITLTVPVTDGVPGDFMVPLQLMSNIVPTLPDETLTVTFAEGETTLTAASGYTATLRSSSVTDFPTIPDVEGDTFTVDTLAFRAGVKRCLIAASTDDARAVLTGVLFEAQDGQLRMVSTDSYRLALAVPGIAWEHDKILVPSSGLDRVNRTIDATDETVDVTVGERAIGFRYGKTSFQTRVIEGEYPAYRNLIPAGQPVQAVVNRAALAKACVRAKALAVDSAVVRLTFTKNRVEPFVVAQDVGQGLEALPAKVTSDGKPLKEAIVVAFNPTYLLQGMQSFESESVTLSLSDPMRPVLFTADDVESLYLQMPVRVP